MKRTIYLILKEDIVSYPPVLSIINVLLELDIKIVHIGVYSDIKQKSLYQKQGVEFIPTITYNGKGNLLKKLRQQLIYRKQVKRFLSDRIFNDGDFIWMFQAETVCLLNRIVKTYPTVIHLFEFLNPIINWKYKLLNPFFNMGNSLLQAKAVITCEYNRSQITKGIFALDKLPFILPNKPYLQEEKRIIPTEIKNIIDNIKIRTKGKKIILYQGVFLADRKLDEFCEAIKNMSDEYVLLLMGKSSIMYDQLKDKYESEKIIFVPFINPPHHLLVTEISNIGILSYIPDGRNIANVINPLYCAPNKIFEYSKFGIPMLGNDIPGLKYIFKEYHCGECIEEPITIETIRKTIETLYSNYDTYVKGSEEYYSSINLKDIIKKIICSV